MASLFRRRPNPECEHGITVGPSHNSQCAECGVRVLDDGFGNIDVGCDDERCDLAIVRPGSVQCSNYCGREGRDGMLGMA